MATTPRQGISVGTSAVRLDADEADTVGGHRLMIVAQAAGTLILGGAGVTSGTGVRCALVAGQSISVECDPGEQLWGVVAASTLLVDVLVQGV